MRRATWRRVKLVGLAAIVLLAIVLVPAIHPLLLDVWRQLRIAIGASWVLTLKLLIVTIIAILFAGLLAPLEALGWWAGWYGDEVNTNLDPGTLAEPLPTDRKVTRYVIYLDGISQAQYEYLPEVERFLEALAIALPDDIVLIKGLMPYSVLNKPLTEDRLLSFFWQLADRFQMTASGGLFGALIGATINIRNVLIVSVAADQRYGPIYNQGTAQVIYNSLINYGYQQGSGVPITLLGYSGGAQMAIGAAPYLKRALKAPIEVISLSGVMSGNHNLLELEHLYHLVGQKDRVEKEGPIMFPRRWQIFFLSYWNRAKKRGKISILSLGPVGHNGAEGPYGAEARLPDGRTHLQQTVELISGIIQDTSPLLQEAQLSQTSNYELYVQAPFNQPSYYPLDQAVDPDLYRPIASWMGRLILPDKNQRRQVKGVLFEVHHADADHAHLVGQVVTLRWQDDVRVKNRVRRVMRDLFFSEDAKYSQQQGCIHPTRLNGWRQVDPLESLAGSRPQDDMIVQLKAPVVLTDNVDRSGDRPPVTLQIAQEPVQITGRFYALVQILQPVEDIAGLADRFHVVHFNRVSRQFDGPTEVVRLPSVVRAHHYGSYPSTNRAIEQSPCNAAGWYIYGAKDPSGLFVVQAIAPRGLLRLQPDEVLFGRTASWDYVKTVAWSHATAEKGKVKSVLLCPDRKPIAAILESKAQLSPEHVPSPDQVAIAQWQAGDRALLIHVYGGIGGKRREPAAKTPIFFGHFAYGVAHVVREPLADELMFDIEYYQVYTHNVDGIIAGTLAWQRFLGDRQFGWLGTRPTCDILLKIDAISQAFDVKGLKRSVLDSLIDQLQGMTARYRIGDGTGGTFVGPAHNCAQDSNQALYTAVKRVAETISANPELEDWLADDPVQADRFQQLTQLTHSLRHKLLPFGSARADWQGKEDTLGISPEENALEGLLRGLGSWRTLLPRLASETVTQQFIEQGAMLWVLRTNQVGGDDPDIEPIVPTRLW